MTKKRNKPFLIKGSKKLASLTSPVRQEILVAMHALNPSTVAEIAEVLNRAPDSLYYHLKILLDVGLILETGVRHGGPRPEALYDLPGRPMVIKHGGGTASRQAIVKTVSGLLRLTDRDFQAAVLEQKTPLDGDEKILTGGRVKAWLNTEQIDQIKEHLGQIEQIMKSGQKAPEADLVAFTGLLIPVTGTRRIRSSPSKKDS